MKDTRIPRLPHDAGIIGLQVEIAGTPTDRLLEMLTLLVEVGPECGRLYDGARTRMRLISWELAERGGVEVGGLAA